MKKKTLPLPPKKALPKAEVKAHHKQLAAKEPDPTARDLQIAIRLINMRWDDLAFDDRQSDQSKFGLYFTAMQLKALAQHLGRK